MRGKVVLTASAGSFPGLVERLRASSLEVEERPLLRFAPSDDWRALDAAVDRLGYGAIAFTSPRAASAFVERARGRGIRWAAPGTRPDIWAVGAGTARALRALPADVQSPEELDVGHLGAATALARAMIAAGVKGPVLFPCGDHRRDELPAQLRAAGIAVDEVVCYHLVLASEAEAREAAARAALLVVASPSVAHLLAGACPSDQRPSLLAVGPTTAEASRASGWVPAAVADRPTVDAIAASVRALLL